METTSTKNNAKAKPDINDVQARLAKLGFKGSKRLGMNILEQEIGETVIITVTGPVTDFVSKQIDKKTGEPAVYRFVNCTNVETGEADMTYWVSGQIVYEFEKMDKYIGSTFAITALGQSEEGFNQFDILTVNN